MLEKILKNLVNKPHTVFSASENSNLLNVILLFTNGRPHATTSEFGHLIGKAPQTIRKIHSQSGACYGIRPLKLGNRLLWSAESIATLLGGGEDYV